MTPSHPDPGSYDQLLLELLEQLNRGTRFEELFAGLYDRLPAHVPCHRLAVALLDDAGEQLRLVACHSEAAEVLKVGFSDPVAGSTLEDLLRTGRPRILNDLPAYLAAKPQSRSTRLIVREGMRANLTLPLVADGRPIGVVFFSSRTAGVYTDAHAELLRRIAGPLAIAVEKARLHDALRRRNDELAEANRLQEGFLQRLHDEVARRTQELRASEERHRRLVTLGRLVNGSLDLGEVVRHAAEALRGFTGCDRVGVALAAGREEWVADDRGVRRESRSAGRGTESAVEWVLRHRQARVAPRLDADRPFPEDRRLFAQGFAAAVSLPLVCRSEAVGVLTLAARRAGAVDGWEPERLAELAGVLAPALDNSAAYERIAALSGRLQRENTYLRDTVAADPAGPVLVGDSPPMRALRRAVEQVAPTDATALVLGETGTGKELVARLVHALSPRRERLFVPVHCAALAGGLIASELFGHETGAFTGATRQRLGRFEAAHGGTLFLDEVAEVPGETQVLLLRALQERVIERVGGHEPIPVDVRLVAATHRDLAAAVGGGRFRADLFYRLNVFPVTVPPLRDRRGDIPALIDHALARCGPRLGKPVTRVSGRSLDLLVNYRWPGNVRELHNLIERAVIVAAGDTLEIDPAWLSGPGGSEEAEPVGWAERERRAIRSALAQSGGKVYGPGGAAELLGLKPTTLYGKMRKHGIRAGRRIGSEPRRGGSE